MENIIGLLLFGVVGTLASGGYDSFIGGHNLGHGSHAFNGHYGGKCGNDGFYYRDGSSFVICSNNNAYVQPCAPGTRNSGSDHYKAGSHYHYRDFCDINLVDYGYGARFGYGHGHGNKGGYGGGHHGGSYGGHQGGSYGAGHHGGYGGHGGHGGSYGGHSGYGGHGHNQGYQEKSYNKEYGYEKGYGHKGNQYGHQDKHYNSGGYQKY